MSTIEILGAVTGLLCVWLTAKERLSSFPFGIANIFVFAFMFYEAKLYADFVLQLMLFLPLTLYGWYVWVSGDKNSRSVAVTRDIKSNEAAPT
jgi:nicotinamide mononucleotide transporter